MHGFRFLFIVSFCVFLAGCADFEALLKEPGEERELVYYNGEAPLDRSYAEMAREMSSGRVQIYGLDSSAGYISAEEDRYSAMGTPVSPNVTVYSLDEPMPEKRVGPTKLPPPSVMDFTSPFPVPLEAPHETASSSAAPVLKAPVPMDMQMQVARAPIMPMVPAPVNAEVGSRIYFNHGSASLGRSGQQVVDFVSKVHNRPLVVEGHASRKADVRDPVERSIVNLKMSMDRAFAVSSDLIRKGVPVERIETRAYGDAQPSPPIGGVSVDAASRRVEIKTGVPANPVNSPEIAAPIPPLARY